MINKKDLIVGNKYLCNANDIITSWEVELTWLGDGWSHDTQNFEGYYPPIVDDVIREVR